MKKTKILHLTLRKKWYDMIASGEKKEEYREIKPYWVARLVDQFGSPESHDPKNFDWLGHRMSMDSPMDYDVVEFKNGYSKNAPTMQLQILGIEIEYGKEKWGAEYGKTYFVIKLGKILTPTNS